MTFKTLDQDAADSDRALISLTLQHSSDNVEAARDTRLRKGGGVYSAANAGVDLLRLCGTVSVDGDGDLRRVVIPHIWRLSTLEVTEFKARFRHDVVGATSDIGLAMVPLTAINKRLQLDDAGDWFDESSEAVAATKTTEVTVTPPDAEKGEYLLFVTWKSALYGTVDQILNVAANVLDGWTARAIWLDASPTTPFSATERPCRVVTYADPVKLEDSKDGELPRPRQLIYTDLTSSAKRLYVYPLHDQHDSIGDRPTATDTIYAQSLSHADLEAVEFYESDVNALPGIGSSLNPGQQTHTIAARQIQTRAENIYFNHSRAFHVGGTARLALLDSVTALVPGAINKQHSFLKYSDVAWRTIGECMVGATMPAVDMGGSNVVRNAYDVIAIFAIAFSGVDGPRTPPPEFDLDVRLRLINLDGVTGAAAGGEDRLSITGMGFAQDQFNPSTASHPIGHLLRLHRPFQAQGEAQLMSHTLLGVYPEDLWHTGRWYVYRGSIKDGATATERLLQIQVEGLSTPDPEAFIHLITWSAFGSSADRLTLDQITT